jgi:hypothetical protein
LRSVCCKTMTLVESIVIPFFTTIFKYLFFSVGVFNHLPNDSLVFISSNAQAENMKTNSAWDHFVQSLGNTFYTPGQNTTSIDEIKDAAMTWFHDNSFLINMACVFGLIAGLTTMYFCFAFCHRKNTGISYHNYFIRIMLLSYYSLTNMAMIYLISGDGSSAFYLLSVAILFFNSLCLPLYCAMILRKNKNELSNQEVMEDYGCIYLQYNRDCYYFLLIVLVKQFLYSVVFIVSHFTHLHKVACLSIQGIVNIVFVGLILYLKPFRRRLYLYQAIMISVLKLVTVGISAVMYAKSSDLTGFLQGLYGLIILSNVLVCIIPLFPWYKRKVQEYQEIQRQQSMDEYLDRTGLPEWVVREYLRGTTTTYSPRSPRSPRF